ncbi:MAG: lipopolysaccharide biosynthesis protein [Porticoccaceae bacterium]
MTITTRTAVVFSAIGRYLTLALQFASTMVLARLLTPEDIGIYSAGFSIVALAHLFRDFGLNQYIIQEKELDEGKIRTTFTLSVVIAWGLGALLFLSAGFAADFFREEGVRTLIHILSFNFLIIPFGSITLSLLRKQLKFHITATISFASSLFGVIVAVWTAYEGASYLCLAYGAITETCSLVLLSSFFRPKDLRIKPTLQNARVIFRFGSIVGAGNIATQLATSATDALIARLLGLAPLGFYSRAFGTFSIFDNLFISSIRPTILPLFSRHNREPEKMVENYLRAVSYAFILAWPFFSFLYLYTDLVILTLYGSQWEQAVPLIKLLCVAGVILPMVLFTDNLFIACGRPGITLQIQLVSNLAKISLVAVACFINLEAVCLALVGYFMIRLVMIQIYLRSVFNLSVARVLEHAKSSVLPLLFTLVPTVFANLLLKPYLNNHIALFSALLFSAFLGWMAGLHITKHAFYDELKPLINRLSCNKNNRT